MSKSVELDLKKITQPVDLELKKAFGDLQVKMVETSKKIQVIDSQIQILKRVFHHVDVTKDEIIALPFNTNTYEAMSRMFVQTDLADVQCNLLMRVAELSERISALEENKRCLEKNLKESEDNLRDMVQLRKDHNEYCK